MSHNCCCNIILDTSKWYNFYHSKNKMFNVWTVSRLQLSWPGIVRASFHHHQHDDEMMPCLFNQKNLAKRTGRHFSFLKKAGRHQKGAGRRALQKQPRQNTDLILLVLLMMQPFNFCEVYSIIIIRLCSFKLCRVFLLTKCFVIGEKWLWNVLLDCFQLPGKLVFSEHKHARNVALKWLNCRFLPLSPVYFALP